MTFVMVPAWSRVWIGAWVPILLVVVWLYLNALVFPPIEIPRSWTSKGISGERLWLVHCADLPRHYDVIQKRLIVLGLVGKVLIASRPYRLHFWVGLLGAVILVLAQLWRIDRFSTLYELLEQVREFENGKYSPPTTKGSLGDGMTVI